MCCSQVVFLVVFPSHPCPGLMVQMPIKLGLQFKCLASAREEESSGRYLEKLNKYQQTHSFSVDWH